MKGRALAAAKVAMPRPVSGILSVAALAAALSLAGALSAAAQSPPAMPMPPSASDPLPKKASPAKTKPGAKARKRARSETGETTGSRGAASRQESYSDRLDTRPARSDRGGFDLEDDPRAIQPTLQNGRAGVGMRF